MFHLDLFACAQQGQQEGPVIRTQEMSALTTHVDMETASTKLEVMLVIVKKDIEA